VTSSVKFINGIPYTKELPKHKLETFTLAQDQHINPKMVVLTPGAGYGITEPDSVQMIVEGAGVQLNGRDFTVNTGDSYVSWSGSPLELVLSAGDVVQVLYKIIKT
jgi:hypothetical protein